MLEPFADVNKIQMQTSQFKAVHTCEQLHTPSVKTSDPIHENTNFSSQSHSHL